MHKCLDHVIRYCDLGQSKQGGQRSKTKSRGKEKARELLPQCARSRAGCHNLRSPGVREFTDKEKFRSNPESKDENSYWAI